MEPLAIAAYVWIASAALVGAMVGALGGATAWVVKRNPLGIGLLVAGGYLVETALLAGYSVKTAVVFGLPPLVLTFLISWITARSLETRARWRRIWATLAAIGCGLIAGLLWGFLFRLSIWAPVMFAVTADVLLILLLLLLTLRASAKRRIEDQIDLELGVEKPHEK